MKSMMRMIQIQCIWAETETVKYPIELKEEVIDTKPETIDLEYTMFMTTVMSFRMLG